jgi:hypothetical protein
MGAAGLQRWQPLCRLGDKEKPNRVSSGKTGDPVLKITIDSEAIKYLERPTVLVSNYGRYMRWVQDATDKNPTKIMGDLPVLVDFEQPEPQTEFGLVSTVKGWAVRPGAA